MQLSSEASTAKVPRLAQSILGPNGLRPKGEVVDVAVLAVSGFGSLRKKVGLGGFGGFGGYGGCEKHSQNIVLLV